MARVIILAALAIVALLGAVGCSDSGITFVDGTAQYSAADVLALPSGLDADAAALRDIPVSEAEQLRHEALVDLRGQGQAGADAATLITKTLPADTAAVPFYVEVATVDSEPAIIVVEAIGPQGSTLRDTRVWALALDGELLLSGTR